MTRAAPSRADAIAALIRERLAHLDHLLGGLPGERQLAEELGASRKTVRAAVARLVEEGVLARHANGRLQAPAPGRSPRRARTVVLLRPPVASLDHQRWHEGVEAALVGTGATLRPISYVHWGDPALHDALHGFDAAFLVPLSEALPAWLLAKIAAAPCRTVLLDQDASAAGIPSAVMFPPGCERPLLQHLVDLGHRRIDCVNTQARDSVIRQRIAAWQAFIAANGITGALRERCEHIPVESARLLIAEAATQRADLGTALYCTTFPAALGAMRALGDAGIGVGHQVSVCAVNDEGLGRYLPTSLTALESPPRAALLTQAVRWMLGASTWRGPRLLAPIDVPLFVGESTSLAPRVPR
jgi:DNA-binding LacI/PurR family transcriptional regulator